jgi:hypothetical protein
MAPATFPQFPLLPQDIQDDIWGRAINGPTVHSLEIFALKPFNQTTWHQTAHRVQSIQQRQSNQPGRWIPLYSETGQTPLVKLAIPQMSDRSLYPGFYASFSRLARLNRMVHAAVAHAVEPRPRDATVPSPKVHAELSGPKPIVPMNMNPEHDLVYITQPSGFPTVWDRIASHRAGKSQYAELKLVHEGQTKSMQHTACI